MFLGLVPAQSFSPLVGGLTLLSTYTIYRLSGLANMNHKVAAEKARTSNVVTVFPFLGVASA